MSCPVFTLTARMTTGELYPTPLPRPNQWFSLWSSALNPEFLWLTHFPHCPVKPTHPQAVKALKEETLLSMLGSEAAVSWGRGRRGCGSVAQREETPAAKMSRPGAARPLLDLTGPTPKR